MTRLVILVPSLPPNANKRSRDWYAGRAPEQAYATLVRLCAMSDRNEWEAASHRHWRTLRKATITVGFVVPVDRHGPLPDYQNLMMGCKGAWDRLTERHPDGIALIEDDTPQCVTWGTGNVTRGPAEQTVITVEGR